MVIIASEESRYLIYGERQRDTETMLTVVADRIFAEGLCLPSGTGMSVADVDRVFDVMIPVLRQI
jgi:dTDP-4-amino-4,6-dideoxygalactose transaminase